MKATIRADFRPSGIPAAIVVIVTVVFAGLSLFRGLNWTLGISDELSLVFANTVFGIHVWGILLTVFSALLLASMALRRHLLVWCGHAFLTAVYFGITLAVGVSVFRLNGGFDSAIAPFGGVIWHGMIAYLMKPIAPQDNVGKADTWTAGPSNN